MPSPRLVLLAFTLLVLALFWSVSANPTTQRTPSPGFVTNYVTPVANLSLDKLLGRWYMAEHVSFESSPHTAPVSDMCLLLDFHYNDNGTLVVAPITLLDGDNPTPTYTLPVGEIGAWATIRDGVLLSSHVAVYVDEHFLAVASCRNGTVKDCGAFVLVRHAEDADRKVDLEEVHRRVAGAGVDNTDAGFVKVIEPCRSNATAAPVLSA